MWEDWLWHAVVPCGAYPAVALAAVLLSTTPHAAFVVGAAALGLLLVGIHNAWDSVTHLVVIGGSRGSGDRRDARDGAERAGRASLASYASWTVSRLARAHAFAWRTTARSAHLTARATTGESVSPMPKRSPATVTTTACGARP